MKSCRLILFRTSRKLIPAGWLAAPLCVIFLMQAVTGANEEQVMISFTGDIIMHGPVRSCAYRHKKTDPASGMPLNNSGFDYLFRMIAPRLNKSDIVVGNMEFPVAPPFESKNTTFNCRPEIIPALRKAGFTLLSIANNHILDQGIEGFKKTTGYLEKFGMQFVGAHTSQEKAGDGCVVTVKGIRVGFLAYTGVLNYGFPAKGCHINRLYDRDRVCADIKKLRGKSDFLVLIAHFGTEYEASPSDADRKLLQGYCDRGVDLVVGHHPHVLQKVESYTAKDGRVCRIFFSLGNFISNQTWENLKLTPDSGCAGPQDSVVVNCILSRHGGAVDAQYEAVPVYIVNRKDPQCKEEWFRDIHTVVISDTVKELISQYGKSASGIAGWLRRIDLIRERLKSGGLKNISVVR